jgi:hypothetical protein
MDHLQRATGLHRRHKRVHMITHLLGAFTQLSHALVSPEGKSRSYAVSPLLFCANDAIISMRESLCTRTRQCLRFNNHFVKEITVKIRELSKAAIVARVVLFSAAGVLDLGPGMAAWVRASCDL